MALIWYGVKTLFRTRATGRPRDVDSAFDPSIDLIEERVVLFRAKGFDDAIARAENEARCYAADTHRNPYGQKVVTQYLGACDAFELFDSPAVGVEVFSSTTLVPSTDRRRALVDRWFGAPEHSADKRRRKFQNRDFSRPPREAVPDTTQRRQSALKKRETALRRG